MKITHLSDLHIKKDDNNSDLRKMFELINYNNSDVVVITGDITDNGNSEEVDIFLKLVSKYLNKKLVLSNVGNHDKGYLGNIYNKANAKNACNKLFRPLGLWDEDYYDNSETLYNIKGLYSYILPEKNTIFYCIDTADIGNTEFFARGKVSNNLLEILKENLLIDSDMKRVVCFHHHPFIRPNLNDINEFGYNWCMELEGGNKLMQVLENNCECVLFGHKHVDEIWFNRNNINIIHAAGKTRNNYKELII